MKTSQPKASVIICTHNPRPAYLERTLEALKSQTLPRNEWELLLIDNASKTCLSENWEVSWHPNGRHIREEELGLTPARVRGMTEAKGNLLVLVDDDNVLAVDYLETALYIATNWPQLGAWSGSVSADFELEPPEWAVPHLRKLALRELNTAIWSNVVTDEEALAFGAGMCLRREVAEQYASRIKTDKIAQALDRRGTDLASGGDDYISVVARYMGLGSGVFPELRLTHIIPASRLSEDYLVRLTEGMYFSGTLVHYVTKGVRPEFNVKKALKIVYHVLRRSRRDRRFYIATQRGEYRAAKFLQSQQV
jgi:glycosyltransferase involved in cell wall biosynthesis